MNWGTRIVILYSTFVVGILFLVIKSTYQKWDLVTEDYYGEEIKYQQKIDEMSNVKALSEKPTIKVDNQKVVLAFPSSLAAKQPAGKINFYKAADKTQDFSVDIKLSPEGTQIVDVPKNYFGKYNAQLNWSAGDKKYYQDFYVYVP